MAGATVLDSGWRRRPPNERIAIACAIGAGLCALVPLAGWAIGEPMMVQVVPSAAPIWPLTALGYLALATSFVAAMRGLRPLALLLLVYPFVLALAAGYERITARPMGLGDLLFASQVAMTSSILPGRPGPLSIGAFLLLSAALALANRPTASTGRVVAILASLSLAFGTFAVASVLIRAVGRATIGLPGTPLTSAFAAILLGLGLLAWRAESGWTGLFEVRAPEWRALRILFPVILMLPIVSAVVAMIIADARAARALRLCSPRSSTWSSSRRC